MLFYVSAIVIGVGLAIAYDFFKKSPVESVGNEFVITVNNSDNSGDSVTGFKFLDAGMIFVARCILLVATVSLLLHFFIFLLFFIVFALGFLGVL